MTLARPQAGGVDPCKKRGAVRMPIHATICYNTPSMPTTTFSELASSPPRRALTLRSFLIGLTGAVTLCAVTPFNDYIVENSFMVGSYLPLFMVMWMFVLVVLINAPLHKFAPKLALQPGELLIILAMTLAACAIPSQGLMRQLAPLPVSLHKVAQTSEQFWTNYQNAGMPSWLFAAPMDADGRNHPTVSMFFSRVQDDEAIPWSDWIVPFAGWGVFILAFWMTLIAIACITRLQWAENERLAFPLAQLQAMLIEPPQPGHGLNRLFRARSFWITCLAVVALHSITAASNIFPRQIPAIPLGFDFTRTFADPPFNYLPDHTRRATLYLTFVGVVYFIPSKVAFSLWFFYLLQQLITMNAQVYGGSVPGGAWMDQQMGAAVALVAGIAVVGRHHWARVVRQMFQRARPGEPVGLYITYRWAGWMLIGGTALMLGWLIVVGATWWFALLIAGFMLMTHLATARIVAQTGLPFIRVHAAIDQVYTNMPPSAISSRDVILAGASSMVGPIASRESLLVFTHSIMQTAEHTPTAEPARTRSGIMKVIVIALIVGYGVAAWAHLRAYYHYAQPITITAQGYENPDGVDHWPRTQIANPLNRHSDDTWASRTHSPALHFGIGLGVMGFLQWGSLTFANWLLAPIGYLTANTYYLQAAWFSLLLGWLVKVLVVRFGGSGLYSNARPVFVGLIFGEALAAGVWMIITLLMVSAGLDVGRIRLLPG
ncbi:MAG TPA: hypothetical protein PKB10_05035 [Tepidisphaeraceae bacterium]|nr:hypothetical protein [Tepidisphaeraceae bacterium]